MADKFECTEGNFYFYKKNGSELNPTLELVAMFKEKYVVGVVQES